MIYRVISQKMQHLFSQSEFLFLTVYIRLVVISIVNLLLIVPLIYDVSMDITAPGIERTTDLYLSFPLQ